MSRSESLEVTGGCHCGAVRFTASVSSPAEVHRCNCSMCRMSGYLHLIVDATDFTLNRGEGELSEYRFNTGVARHFFCRQCGVKSFYVPRSHPDGYSLNFNCLDEQRKLQFTIIDFDGRHWRANVDRIRN